MNDQPDEPLTYVYEPEPNPFGPGATRGHIVIWNGGPGPASRADAVWVTDEEGHGFITVTSDFEACTITDDPPRT